MCRLDQYLGGHGGFRQADWATPKVMGERTRRTGTRHSRSFWPSLGTTFSALGPISQVMKRRLRKAQDHTSVRQGANRVRLPEVQCSCLHLPAANSPRSLACQRPSRAGAGGGAGRVPSRRLRKPEPLNSLTARPEISLVLQMKNGGLRKAEYVRCPESPRSQNAELGFQHRLPLSQLFAVSLAVI